MLIYLAIGETHVNIITVSLKCEGISVHTPLTVLKIQHAVNEQ